MESPHRRHQNIRNDCNIDKKQIDFSENIVFFIKFLIILWEIFDHFHFIEIKKIHT